MMNEATDYKTIVKKENGHFFMICESLNLVSESADLVKAYDELQSMRSAFLERCKKVGITPPQSGVLSNETKGLGLSSDERALQSGEVFKMSNTPLNSSSNNFSFFIKTLIVVGIVFVPLSFVISPVIKTVSHLERAVSETSSSLNRILTDPNQTSLTIAKFASVLQEITPERREEVRKNLHIIVEELKPFVSEMQSLWNESKEKNVTHKKNLLTNNNIEIVEE